MRIMDGAIPEREHRSGGQARVFAERLQAWRRMTGESARSWALLLAEGMPCTAPGLHAALAREIEACAGQLLWGRMRLRGMNPAQLAGAGPIERRGLGSAARSPLRTPETPGETGASSPGGAEFSAGLPARSNPSRPYVPPVVTREVFERFCRWTGMDPGCLGGSEESQAGLVFYLVMFAMLTGPGGSPDLPSLRLFKKLRQCREQMIRQAEDFFRSNLSAFPRAAPRPASTEGGVNERTVDAVCEGLLADRTIQ